MLSGAPYTNDLVALPALICRGAEKHQRDVEEKKKSENNSDCREGEREREVKRSKAEGKMLAYERASALNSLQPTATQVREGSSNLNWCSCFFNVFILSLLSAQLFFFLAKMSRLLKLTKKTPQAPTLCWCRDHGEAFKNSRESGKE